MGSMPSPDQAGIVERVRRLAEFLNENDLRSVRIERDRETLEVGGGAHVPAVALREAVAAPIEELRTRIETISSDLVGIFHLGRPAPYEGEILEGDRELGYVEALGIRNPVRSLGSGRIVSVLQHDGDIVDYGRPLFEVDRE